MPSEKDGPESNEFTRGFNAAMKQAEERVRRAERTQESVLLIACQVHHMALRIAEWTKPGAEIYQHLQDVKPRFFPLEGVDPEILKNLQPPPSGGG